MFIRCSSLSPQSSTFQSLKSFSQHDNFVFAQIYPRSLDELDPVPVRAPDGRFVAINPVTNQHGGTTSGIADLVVVQNWFAELTDLVPVPQQCKSIFSRSTMVPRGFRGEIRSRHRVCGGPQVAINIGLVVTVR